MRNNKNYYYGKNNTSSNIEYVFGRNSALAYLDGGNVKNIYLQSGFDFKPINDILSAGRFNVQYVDNKFLDNISSNGNHQGIVLEIPRFEYSSLDEIITKAKAKDNPLILILDEINDPHNFGAIIRSADAFDVDGIIIKNRNQVLVTPTVSKVSTGAIRHVKICQVNNLSNAIKELKDNGYWIYSADGSGTTDYSKVNYKGKTALVVGSEGFGISKLVLSNSDVIVKIPMYGHVNSLNVSVATGILLANIRRS